MEKARNKDEKIKVFVSDTYSILPGIANGWKMLNVKWKMEGKKGRRGEWETRQLNK